MEEKVDAWLVSCVEWIIVCGVDCLWATAIDWRTECCQVSHWSLKEWWGAGAVSVHLYEGLRVDWY